ncbi:hypothetical protein GTA08_BOTSDO11772 [Botryosphaeria dothidea]|uniref:RING-type domain-containing protein n=1 Tax=Botryosphaeria dothidea TaxID=55169 RepID=A0A8H4J6F7_9PEZI|nr:hypothetical protein GTA08_BOTSDO11772 [Botryosphaeria dothidea]
MASRPPTPTREEFFLHGIERVPTDSTDDTAPGATECAICLNAYDDEVPVRIIQCGHIFGQQCLSSILDNSCTMCRAQLFHEGDPYDPDDDLPTTEAHDRFHEALAIISETTDRHNYEEDPRVYARTRFEASAAAATAGRSRLYDRTLYGHTVRFRLPRIPRAPGVAPPTGDSAARDPRPYETVPVLEEIHERDFLRATPPPLCPHVRVSVRPAAIWFNFFSYFRALAAVFDGTVLEWCLEREGELCKVEELHESWARLAWQIPGWIRSRARDALHELGISDDPIEFLLLAIEFVLQWRGVRELEVFGGLVHEVLEEEDDVLEFGVIAWDLALDVDDW